MMSGIQGNSEIKKNNWEHRQLAAKVVGLLVVTLALVGWVVSLASNRRPIRQSHEALGADLPPYWKWLESDGANAPLITDAARPVYAYSVIPGGVRSGNELKLALARDSIAAAHYSGFDAQSARPVRLDRPRQVYISYRLGNRVYWTSKKVTLPAGERLLTDGKHLVRSRCGNRISEVRTDPTSPGEPAEPVLSAPIFPRATAETVDLPPPPPIWTETPSTFLLAMAPTPGPTSGGGVFIPPFPFVPCCGGSSGGSHTPLPPTPPPTPTPPIPPTPPVPPVIPPPGPGPSPNPPPTPPPPPPLGPPVPAPEPRTMEMLLIGLAGALLLAKLRRT